MEITRDIVKIFTIVAGGLVLASYVWGVSRLSQPSDLWGGVGGNLQRFSIIFMFVAAIGYLIYWWITLFQMDSLDVSNLRWPWGESDNKGTNRLLLSFAIFLIPSALWIESTGLHLRNPTDYTPFLVVGTLLLASVGNIMLGLLAFSAYQDEVPRAGWLLFGAFALSIQCIVNDLIIWSWKFPW
tara:strand:- start:344 stop:895 length:552 start_codon:yes stop_codon:yes gene_type:complete